MTSIAAQSIAAKSIAAKSIAAKSIAAVRKSVRSWSVVATLTAAAVVAASCIQATGELGAAVSGPAAAAAAQSGPETAADMPAGSDPYLLFNQRMIEGALQPAPLVDDVDALFAQVFHGLPDEVVVYPSENYYYFVLYTDQRQIWGNIRLPAGARDEGELSFGYFEFVEFPWRSGEGESGSKFYNADDGVMVSAIDRFTYRVAFEGKEVVFHLHQLDQSPPNLFPLAER